MVALNFKNKTTILKNKEHQKSHKKPITGKTTKYFQRSVLDGKYNEVYLTCTCCERTLPMESFPARSEARIRYKTFGLTESVCRECWNSSNYKMSKLVNALGKKIVDSFNIPETKATLEQFFCD